MRKFYLKNDFDCQITQWKVSTETNHRPHSTLKQYILIKNKGTHIGICPELLLNTSQPIQSSGKRCEQILFYNWNSNRRSRQLTGMQCSINPFTRGSAKSSIDKLSKVTNLGKLKNKQHVTVKYCSTAFQCMVTLYSIHRIKSESRATLTLFTPRVKPWVIQSCLTFDSMGRTLKCDHSLESC